MSTIAYFSYTGNTKFLATELQNQLEAHLFNVAFDDVNTLRSGDHLILMFAIHAFNAPDAVLHFAKQIPAQMFKHVHFIAVGCNQLWVNDAATLKLKSYFENKGYDVGVNRTLAMPLTLITKFPSEAGTKMVEEAKLQLIEISHDIKDLVIDNKAVSFKAKSLNSVGKLEKTAAKLFGLELYANDNCISCGRCWNECPMHNITCGKHQKPKFGFKCSICMKCIYDCPKNAIQPRVSKFIPVKGGYSLKDYLVESNRAK